MTTPQPTQELSAFKLSGFLALMLTILSTVVGVKLAINLFSPSYWNHPLPLATPEIIGLILLGVGLISLFGLVSVQPNQACVLIFLGSYIGTIAEPGFWWVNPFTIKTIISLRVRNFNSDRLKVNEADGSPIEIGAVVVWRVVNSAKAYFDVDSYQDFVAIQSETAIRSLAIRYPYDTNADQIASLKGSPEEVTADLKQELQSRLEVAGVEVIDSRLSYLAYAPEIAQAMLRRQQAQAIVAARQQIIEGALGMVEMSFKRLEKQQLLNLDDATKKSLINNLLVVLTAEQNIQPVINTGSLQL